MDHMQVMAEVQETLDVLNDGLDTVREHPTVRYDVEVHNAAQLNEEHESFDQALEAYGALVYSGYAVTLWCGGQIVEEHMEGERA